MTSERIFQCSQRRNLHEDDNMSRPWACVSCLKAYLEAMKQGCSHDLKKRTPRLPSGCIVPTTWTGNLKAKRGAQDDQLLSVVLRVETCAVCGKMAATRMRGIGTRLIGTNVWDKQDSTWRPSHAWLVLSPGSQRTCPAISSLGAVPYRVRWPAVV